MGILIVVILPLRIDIWYVNFSQKPLELYLYPPTSIDLTCDPLGLYILLVNNSIDPIMPIG